MKKNYKNVSLFKIIGIILVLISLLFMMCFFQRCFSGRKKHIIKCKYTAILKSDLTTMIKNDKYNLNQVVGANTYKIFNTYKRGKIYNYKYKLNQWFQSEDVNVALCSFCVKKNDGAEWTESDFNDFKTLYLKGKIEVNFLVDGSIIEPKFKLSQNKKTLIIETGTYYNSLYLKLNNKNGFDFIREVDIYESDDTSVNPICFASPDKCTSSKKKSYHGNKKEYVSGVVVNSYGLNIELNISKQLAEYKKRIKKLKPNESEEDIGYDICNIISLKYEDGSIKQYYTKDLCAKDSGVSLKDADMIDEFISEKQKKAAITVIRDIDLDKTVSIIINQKEYKLR